MTIFRVEFTREVIAVDLIVREIEADSADEAEMLAMEMAGEFDGSCPDDFTKGDDRCEGWAMSDLMTQDEARAAGFVDLDDAGDFCRACRRLGADCSADPCPAVIADRAA